MCVFDAQVLGSRFVLSGSKRRRSSNSVCCGDAGIPADRFSPFIRFSSDA